MKNSVFFFLFVQCFDNKTISRFLSELPLVGLKLLIIISIIFKCKRLRYSIKVKIFFFSFLNRFETEKHGKELCGET